VPDGLLHDVPWSALPLAWTDMSAALVIDYGPILEYGGEPRLAGGENDPGELTLLAIGCDSAPGTTTGLAGLPQLRRAEQEALMVHAQWPNPFRQLRVGAGARWDNIVGDDLAESGVIHLASHAEVHQGMPQRSTLRLSSGDSAEPVTLQAVSNLELNAELVYLSCCNAARRMSTGGSGVSDFAGAFLAAGARTVIASTHWVDDEAAAFMAERFYENWFAGRSKAQALRAAQQELRAAREAWNHPSYWAFFRLIGDER